MIHAFNEYKKILEEKVFTFTDDMWYNSFLGKWEYLKESEGVSIELMMFINQCRRK
ncbi:hypothetical protein AVV36_gp142 [Pectobacterium bacteriophage PM2]|uniref:Uncharacterized protein n=1 Tax=Pectobacterium bacteriophage PM2 TaxID=1429794 RepID=A0A0A0PZI1_9CAUD|nr:hypothetical protein AVV36_gp142 [Pectobacterium bacteriophage PM2]AHY25104.1 hypothetical protein PM2_142 [Pectobacterium bacteriophage PM2]